LQNRFTYLRPTPRTLDRFHIDIDDNVMDFACSRDIPLMAYSPLLQGFYTDVSRPIPALCAGSHNEKRLQMLQRIASEVGDVSLNCLVLAWMRAQKAEIIPLLSGDTPDQITDNLAAQKITLTETQLTLLNNA
jgi:aryl-alcohol dehydrogenase-like predicted oxidoreductase